MRLNVATSFCPLLIQILKIVHKLPSSIHSTCLPLFPFSLQLQIWKKLIAWERSNPTRTDDQAVLVEKGECI